METRPSENGKRRESPRALVLQQAEHRASITELDCQTQQESAEHVQTSILFLPQILGYFHRAMAHP